jgi:hypothetical protein
MMLDAISVPLAVLHAHLRVPAVYLGSALLSVLSHLSERRMNNLRGFNGGAGFNSLLPHQNQDKSSLHCSGVVAACGEGAQSH